MNRLSIIIPTVNDPFLDSTVASIRATAGDGPEIVIVDDCSACIVPPSKHYEILHNAHRIGCGPSRHLGALKATGDYLLFTDSHMRFLPGWYEKAMERITGRPETLHCCVCLTLDREHMDPEHPLGFHCGATMNLCGPDRNKPGAFQVFEPVWLRTVPDDDQDIPCVMGACYFIPREWYLKLSPLRFLRGWWGDEVMLSLCAWFAGGQVRIIKTFGIGHKFKLPDEKLLFKTPLGAPTYSKLLAMHLLLHGEELENLVLALKRHSDRREFETAEKMLHQDFHILASERMRLWPMFTRDFSWFKESFGIT